MVEVAERRYMPACVQVYFLFERWQHFGTSAVFTDRHPCVLSIMVSLEPVFI